MIVCYIILQFFQYCTPRNHTEHEKDPYKCFCKNKLYRKIDMNNIRSSVCENAYKWVHKVLIVLLYSYRLDFRAMSDLLSEKLCCGPL